MKFPTRIKE